MRKRLGAVLFGLLAVAGLPVMLTAGTVNVSGTIGVDTTWTNTDTVVVTANVTVSGSGKLTVQPGTVIQFYPSTYLRIEKVLTAQGDSANPIVFTSRADTLGGAPTAGSWSGLILIDAASNNTLSCSVAYCDIRYAGTGLYYSDYPNGDAAHFRHVSSSNASSMGFGLYGACQLDSCTTSRFGSYGVYVGVSDIGVDVNLVGCTAYQDSDWYHTGVGFYATSYLSFHLTDCVASGCRNGIELYQRPVMTVERCRVEDNSNIGVYLHPNSSNVPRASFRNCNFDNTWNIYVDAGSDTVTVIDARQNWFGTTDAVAIATSIYDHTDATTSPSIDFSGFLDAPYPTGNPVTGYFSARFESDTTLTAAGGPYYLVGRCAVNRGVKLTIEPGTEIYSMYSAWLSVEGQIEAIGTPANRILFTSMSDTAGGAPVANDWSGIRLTATSDSATCRLSYCDIQYGGNALYVRDCRSPYPALFDNLRIKKTSGYAVYLYDSNVEIDSSDIADSYSNGIYIGQNLAPEVRVAIRNTILHQDTVHLIGQYYGVAAYGTNTFVTLEDCEIYNFASAVYSYCSSSSTNQHTTITRCNIHDNASYGLLFHTPGANYALPTGDVHYCNFSNNGSVDVYAEACSDRWTTSGIDARFNWWGTANPLLIPGEVYDFTDNQAAAPVDCSFPLDAPYPAGSPIANCIAGVIDSDTTFPAAGSPYLVIGSPQFRRGQVYTIEPGTEFRFAGATGLYVDGLLDAQGDSLNHIRFTAAADTVGGNPVEGYWKGLDLLGNSDSAECVIDWCEISWADDGVYLTDNRAPYPVRISNCKIENVSANSLVLTNSSGLFSNLENRNFGSNGVYIDGSISPLIAPEFYDCRFAQDTVTRIGVGNAAYLRGSLDARFTSCEFAGSGDGIEVYRYNTSYPCEFALDSCYIHDILSQGIYLYPASYPSPVGSVHNCNITDCGSYYLGTQRCSDSLTTPGIDARGNWWGTADPFVIAQRIKDCSDDPDHPPVDCRTWLDGPVGTGAELGGDGYLSGAQSNDTTLTIAHSPYRVLGTWVVQQGAHLRIDPGVEIQFAPGTGIRNVGNLIARGDSLNHIRFTAASDTVGGAPQAGDWYGIGLSNASDAQPCSLQFCDFRYATYALDLYDNDWPWPAQIQYCDFRDLGAAGMSTTNSKPHLSHSVIEDFQSYGVYVTGANASPTIEYTTIDQDSSIHVGLHGYGIYLYNDGHIKVSGCRITDMIAGVYAYNYSSTPPTFDIVNTEISDNSSNAVYIGNRYYNGYYQATPRGSIRYCNLAGNTGQAIYVYRSSDPTAVIYADHNWWGITDSATITNNMIYDHTDYVYSPYVSFMPVSAFPNRQPCLSDFDASGRTDYDDLAMLGYSFGAHLGDDNWLVKCNISQVSVSATRIDGFDLALFGSQYGNEGGCAAFAKLQTVPADNIELLVRCSETDGGSTLTFEPRLPGDASLLGLVCDVVVDTSRFQLPASLDARDDRFIQFGRVEGNRLIFSIMSLTGEPIGDRISTAMIPLTSRDGVGSASITIENAAVVVDGYALAMSPLVTVNTPSLPTKFALEQNYPNPFNPSTTIGFSLAARSDATITILNVLGQELRQFTFHDLEPGHHELIWDGRDRWGMPVATGVYLYRLEAGSQRTTRKMLLLK